MEPIRQLESARLLLRQWHDEDLPAFAAMCADPQVMRYFPAPLSRLESAALIGRVRGHFAKHGFGLWALERKDTGAFIGFTGLGVVGFDAPFTPAGAWPASTGAWATPVKRRGPRCAAALTDWRWMKWCPSPLKPTCLRRKSCRQSVCTMIQRMISNIRNSHAIIHCVTMCFIASAVNNGCKPCMDKQAQTFTMARWARAGN
jgi:hypothetical protein